MRDDFDDDDNESDYADDFSAAGDNRRVCLVGVPTIPIQASLLGEDRSHLVSAADLQRCDAAIAAGTAEIRRRHLEQLRVTGHSYRRRGYAAARTSNSQEQY